MRILIWIKALHNKAVVRHAYMINDRVTAIDDGLSRIAAELSTVMTERKSIRCRKDAYTCYKPTFERDPVIQAIVDGLNEEISYCDEVKADLTAEQQRLMARRAKLVGDVVSVSEPIPAYI